LGVPKSNGKRDSLLHISEKDKKVKCRRDRHVEPEKKRGTPIVIRTKSQRKRETPDKGGKRMIPLLKHKGGGSRGEQVLQKEEIPIVGKRKYPALKHSYILLGCIRGGDTECSHKGFA